MDSISKPVVKKRRPFLLFFIGLIAFLVLLYLIFSFPPTFTIHLSNVTVSILIPVFLLLFFILYSLAAFLFISALQGIVIASMITIYLILSYFTLNQWIFIILLLGVFGCIEFAIFKKK